MTLPTFTPEEAKLLDRGYAHLAILTDGHADDAPNQVDKATKKALLATDPVYFVQWQRQVAIRFAWGLLGPLAARDGSEREVLR